MSTLTDDIFHFVSILDNEFYIRKTCSKKIFKKQIPCQAVCNKLLVFDFPQELKRT